MLRMAPLPRFFSLSSQYVQDPDSSPPPHPDDVYNADIGHDPNFKHDDDDAKKKDKDDEYILCYEKNL